MVIEIVRMAFFCLVIHMAMRTLRDKEPFYVDEILPSFFIFLLIASFVVPLLSLAFS